MRLLLQRVISSSVTVDGETVGKSGKGYMILFGAAPEDSEATADALARKVAALRVFEDGNGKMNLSIADVGGSVLCVSQFTLYADCAKGNRPSFTDALGGEKAKQLYDLFNTCLRDLGLQVEEGIFGADMKIALVNDGPVTIILDSEVLW